MLARWRFDRVGRRGDTDLRLALYIRHLSRRIEGSRGRCRELRRAQRDLEVSSGSAISRGAYVVLSESDARLFGGGRGAITADCSEISKIPAVGGYFGARAYSESMQRRTCDSWQLFSPTSHHALARSLLLCGCECFVWLSRVSYRACRLCPSITAACFSGERKFSVLENAGAIFPEVWWLLRVCMSYSNAVHWLMWLTRIAGRRVDDRRERGGRLLGSRGNNWA